MSNGERREFSFLDILNVASFLIAIENLDMNLTQNDKAELQRDLTAKSETILKEVHEHLEMQDTKINEILSILKELKKYDS